MGAWPFSFGTGRAGGGGWLCLSLFVRCLLGLKCIQTTMSKDSGHTGSRGQIVVEVEVEASIQYMKTWMLHSPRIGLRCQTGAQDQVLRIHPRAKSGSNVPVQMRRTRVTHQGTTRGLQDR
jgi:hypothetical protein